MTDALLKQLSQLSPESLAMIRAENLRRIVDAESKRKIDVLFPDTGPLRRELYPKHIAFFAAGAQHQERAIVGGNRTGKTLTAGVEVTFHATGQYPHWWPGRRFNRPVSIWACGEDAKAVRESLQETLLGRPEALGTGIIPGDAIRGTTARSGVPEAIDTVQIAHATGGASRIVLKTYDQGRESYQGAAVDVVWFDEEPPLAIYTEGLTRTMATVPGEPNGLILCTFTPLRGLSGVVLLYLPGGRMAE